MTGSDSMEERIAELETKLSFQEHIIGELNEVVTSQQRQLDRLQQALAAFKAQLDQALPAEIKPLGDEAPPPHY